MLSLKEKLSEFQLLLLRATFHALPLFFLRTEILRTSARLEINPYLIIIEVRLFPPYNGLFAVSQKCPTKLSRNQLSIVV